MERQTYKNQYNRDHYERINIALPKGMKEIFKARASEKGMSLSAYIVDLMRQDQLGMFDSMQIADKNKEHIRSIVGNMHDGYVITFDDGHILKARTKLEARKGIIAYLQ
jgi:hypothetical protein